MLRSTQLWGGCLILLVATQPEVLAEVPFQSVEQRAGSLSVLFRDNSQSPQILSGLGSLYHQIEAPAFDAFDPDTRGASAGLNFEHIISGHPNPNNKFTPRHGRYRLVSGADRDSFVLVRQAQDSPWNVDSQLTYRVVPPHYIDFEFQCTPRDAGKFGQHGYAIFFFANYMNDVADVALHFRGHTAREAQEAWIAADAPKGPIDWTGGGNYRSLAASDLPMDDDVQFRLNTWTYDWPRISQPFYFGRAEHDMTLILMFDRLHQTRDQIRFSLYKFKLPRFPRPAWDFQYVINKVQADQSYRFRGRLVWKRFISAEDCQEEYQRWNQSVQADRIGQLRALQATVFQREGRVVEVNANRSQIANGHLRLLETMTELTDLSLESTQISDGGIPWLANLQKLEWLNLYRCPIGDDALATLKQLKRLQHLPIGSTRVTDQGLRHLAEMRQLVYLGLRDTQISDEGLQHVANLTNLTGLHLGETAITDEGLNQLRRLNKLQKLWLDQTLVTDQGVDRLSHFTDLHELHLRGTRITEDGIRQLRRALPRCEIMQ